MMSTKSYTKLWNEWPLGPEGSIWDLSWYPGDRQGTLIIIMQSFGYIVKSVPVDQTGPRISISPMRGSKFHMELQLF